MFRKARIGICRSIVDEKGRSWLAPNLLEKLNELTNVACEPLPDFSPEIRPEQIKSFDIIIAGSPKWTKDSLAGNTQLLHVAKMSAGYNQIDVPALTQAGVLLTNCPEGNRRPVAVAIITFILALSTRLLSKERIVREGQWQKKEHCVGYGLVGKTLGSVGVGNIGHEMFRLAKAFGMRHIAYDPYVSQETVADVDVRLVDLDAVLTESDFLNISCPLNENTYHLIGVKEFYKMKKTAFLINTARGPIVDEAALIKALQEGTIRGAALDVFEQEPLPLDNPLLKMDVDKVMLTPHDLANTDERAANYEAQILRQIKQVIHGDVPEALVNREVLQRSEFQDKLKSLLSALNG